MGDYEGRDGLIHDEMSPKGENFLVSSLMSLKRQREELQDEVQELRHKLSTLEQDRNPSSDHFVGS